MSRDTDIPRWSALDAEVPADLGRLLRDGRADAGSEADVAELARRLSAVLGPGAGLPGPESRSSTPASGPRASTDVGAAGRLGGAPSSAARWVGAAIATTGVVAGVWWSLSRAPDDAGARPPSAKPEASTPAASAAPAPESVTAPGAAPAAETSEAPAMRAPENAAPPPAAHERATPPRVTPPRVTSAPSAHPRPMSADVAAEARLLERARGALQHQPAEALRLTREHEARFAHGALAQEREVIAIEALRRLGRHAAAQTRAAEFERHYRGSVHQPRLERGSDTSAPSGGAGVTLP